ncbi:MAG: divalent cation transporter [Planctomycetota bacterium]
MNQWLVVALLTLMAGAAMPVGALIARIEHFQSRWLELEFRHTVMAFGGGALLSAVALVLVPDGTKVLALPWSALCFAAGGVAFMALDMWLARSQRPASQLAAMLADFVPESMAMGAAFAHGESSGLLLALLMALQNLPEGFNAYREITRSTSIRSGRTIAVFAGAALLGPAAGLAGYAWLADVPHVVGGVMLFAAGGILYAVMQDVAPQARLTQRWSPPLGAVAGFLLGMVGDALVGG